MYETWLNIRYVVVVATIGTIGPIGPYQVDQWGLLAVWALICRSGTGEFKIFEDQISFPSLSLLWCITLFYVLCHSHFCIRHCSHFHMVHCSLI